VNTVTKYVKVGIEPAVDNSTRVSVVESTIATETTIRAQNNNEITASVIPMDKIDHNSGTNDINNSSKKMLAIFERNHNMFTGVTVDGIEKNSGSHYQNRTALGFDESSIGNRRNDCKSS
jgi:hypothetical protein